MNPSDTKMSWVFRLKIYIKNVEIYKMTLKEAIDERKKYLGIKE